MTDLEKLSLEERHERENEALKAKYCPRCGHKGGLINCEKCHSTPEDWDLYERRLRYGGAT